MVRPPAGAEVSVFLNECHCCSRGTKRHLDDDDEQRQKKKQRPPVVMLFELFIPVYLLEYVHEVQCHFSFVFIEGRKKVRSSHALKPVLE